MKRCLLATLVVAALCHCGPALAEHAVSREFTVNNSPESVIPPNTAVSREFTVFNAPDSLIPANAAVSREFTLNNDPAALIPANTAVSREFTGYLKPYTFAEISQALRIAAGLDPGTADTVLRLNVVIAPPSTTVVDVLDAIRVEGLWKVAPPDE